MSLEADRVLASSTCSTGNWTLPQKFCARQPTQVFGTRFHLSSIYAGSYTTSRPCNGKDRSSAIENGTRIFKLDSTYLDTFSGKKCRKDLTTDHDETRRRDIDVTTFGNLCVDIVLSVQKLPPPTYEEKLAYMNNLARSSLDEKFWEAGGNSNFAIAAARLGLHCAALGHVGYEKYGFFLHDVLEKEGVQVIRLKEEDIQEETLVCWVLVDSNHCHGFCSRFDFNKDPAFTWIKELPVCAKETIQRSKVLFLNGFLFDEITPEMITLAVDVANETGCAVFFDPGPRVNSLCKGPLSQQHALRKLLNCSDVLLLTADEAKTLTGLDDPMLSAKDLLCTGQRTKWVIVKLGSRGCLMATAHNMYQVPAFKVDVKDTVGCGDSFAGAIALGYTRELPILTTLVLANAVGAATAMGCGAGRNVATVDEVRNILANSNVSGDCKVVGGVSKFGGLKMPLSSLAHEAVNFLLNSAQTSSLT